MALHAPPATAGRIDSDVAVGELGVETVEVTDVVVVLVDVDELVQAARRRRAGCRAGPGTRSTSVVNTVADGRAVDRTRVAWPSAAARSTVGSLISTGIGAGYNPT